MAPAGAGLAGWREAWACCRDNPLLRLWVVGDARRDQRRAWWRQSPGLFLLALGVCAAVTYLLVLLIMQFLALRPSALATQDYSLSLLRAGTLVLAWGALALGAGWMLSRLYTCAHLVLGLLGARRRKEHAGLDEALRASGISDEQVVLSVVLHAWRLLLAPVLVLNVANACVYYFMATVPRGLNAAQHQPPLVPWDHALLLAVAFTLWQTLAATVGAGTLMLLLLMLGRGASPLAPVFGAASLVLLQLPLMGSMVTDASLSPVDQESIGQWALQLGLGAPLGPAALRSISWGLSALAWAGACACFYLFFWAMHRVNCLRRVIAHSLLLFLALQFLWCLWDPLTRLYNPVLTMPLILAQTWQAAGLSLIPAGAFCGYCMQAGALDPILNIAPSIAAITLLQLVLCLPLAQLARDAVRRYRRGEA